LIYSHEAKISAWKFLKKTVTNNVVSGSSESGNPILWELMGERVNARATQGKGDGPLALY